MECFDLNGAAWRTEHTADMDERTDHQHNDPEQDMDVDMSVASQKVSTEDKACWGSLPDVCLLHIFEFLCDKDRMSADLACRHWHHVMRSPSLWRYRLFHFTGTASKDRISERFFAVTYACSLGAYLETLEVILQPPSKRAIAHRMEHAITGLLSELIRVKAPLRSLSIINLGLDAITWTNKHRRSVVNSLLKLIRKGSSKLTSVCLKMMGNGLKHGLELLSALANHQHHDHIWHLDLCGFFSDALLNIYLNPDLPPLLGQLRGLTDLILTCRYLSDDLLLALIHTQHGWRQQPRLKHLILRYGLCEPPQQVVHGSSWLDLVSACPGLKVTFISDHFINRSRLARILLPEVPIKEFFMTSFYSDDHDPNARTLLCDLLPQYRHCLESLTLDLCNCRDRVDEKLVELVDLCECLKLLRVWALLDVLTVGRLVNIRLTKRTSLNTMKIRLFFMDADTGEQEEQLVQLLSTYHSLPPELFLHISFQTILQ